MRKRLAKNVKKPQKCTTRYKDRLYCRADDMHTGFEKKYDELYSIVQSFRNVCLDSIDYEYLDIIDDIELFRSSLDYGHYSGKQKLLEKLDKLENMADEYRFELYRRADEEILLPTLDVVNLSNRLSVVDMEDTRDPDQRSRNDQDTTIEPGNSSTPSNPLEGVELHLNSNNDIDIVNTRNTLVNNVATGDYPPPHNVDPTVPIPGADSGVLPLYPTGTDTYDQKADIEEGGNDQYNFLTELHNRYEFNSTTQGNDQLNKTIQEIVQFTKKNRQIHDNLTAEMTSVRNDQTMIYRK